MSVKKRSDKIRNLSFSDCRGGQARRLDCADVLQYSYLQNLAEKYGIQPLQSRPDDRLSDYTRKSIASFVQEYPNVGLLVCLGEALTRHKDLWLRV